ncbi:MAG: hypothetical protein Q9166_004611 [cf. Caloplaca sp. 2 TL-2023]
MPPKRQNPPPSKGAFANSSSYSSTSAANKAIAAPSRALQSTYRFLTAQENQGIVRAVGLFGDMKTNMEMDE